MEVDEARRRFASARVARLATVGVDGQPHLVPVTFSCVGNTIFSAVDGKPKSTRDLKRLRNIEAHPQVTLLVDLYSDDWDDLWWVRVDGAATVVWAGPEFDPGIASLREKYPQYAQTSPAGPLVLVQVQQWRGWAAAGSDGGHMTGQEEAGR